MIDTCSLNTSSIEIDTSGFTDGVGAFLTFSETAVNDMSSLMLSLCLSAGAIAVIYIFKHRLIAKNMASSLVWVAVAEYPIDICITLIPIIAIGTVENQHPYFGILLVMVAIIIIFFAYLLRSFFFKMMNSGDKIWHHLIMLANYLLTGSFIAVIVELILNSWEK